MAMDQHLIDTINKLQDALAPIGTSTIDLPQITVVGSQSSGKSSVLENIVGRDFLPRGTGIVTRRPLILQLINRRPTAANGSIAKPSAEAETVDRVNDTNPDEWGEFLHKPGQKFHDFNEIRNEIVRETELKTGNNAGISSSPINLKIYSPHVLTLTLVDLPGLTKVPVGDQPKDIEIQIKEMILKFISKPNAIILSVTAANTDLANSDGLKLAREVDPEGNRTIGVLTKIDLMDQGTDVLDILSGRVIPLKYGYIPVINRGQKDITTNKSIGAALKFEKEFFESHSAYRSRAQYCGTPYLAKSLNMILLNHIRNTMPEIKARIENSLKKFKAELAQIGPPMLNSSPSTIVLSAITEFCNEYRAILEGQGNDISSSELSGGARISFVLHEIFVNGINALDPFDQIRDVDIRTILYNSAGLSPNLFVGTAAFEVLVQKQIHRFESPCLKCITLIYDELVRILSQILAKPQFNQYPALKDSVYDVFIGFLHKSLVPTNKIVTDIVTMEETYINTGHPDLIKGNHAMAMVTEKLQLSKPVQLDPKTGKPIASHQQQNYVTESKSSGGGFFSNFFASKNKSRLAAMEAPPATLRASGQMTERETMETEVIKILIQSYFSIVKRTIIDLVPKAIMLKLVLLSKQDIQTELLENLYQSDSLNELLKENEKTVKRREELEKMVAVLGKALDIVSNV